MRTLMPSILLLTLSLLPAARMSALQTDELLAVTAMPLAVAAATDGSEVLTNDLVDVVRLLNAAAVPAPQFIEVVRYTPAAIVVEETPDPFVAYLEDQYDAGLRGDEYVTVVQNRLRTYDLGPVDLNVVEPVAVRYVETSYFEPQTFFPEVVQTRISPYYAVPMRPAYDRDDLIALAAMPLAVVAVSELTGVPTGDLFNLVGLLNAAAVPPVQFVETVRYAPAALVVDDGREPFVVYLQERYDSGLRGPQFVTVVEDRLRTYDLGAFDIDVLSPRLVRYEPEVFSRPDDFFPPIVRTRVIERSTHPHGGPPGQIKKQIGVQTGAEVVHGNSRRRTVSGAARNERNTQVIVTRERTGDRVIRNEPPGQAKKNDARVAPSRKQEPKANAGSPGQGKKDENKGQGKGKGGNPGKGKGKD
jgi:hypothetical protein